jgi:hypothetical protein
MRPTSMGSWPTLWVASSRKKTPASRAISPTASTGCTRPPLVGTWASAMSRTRPLMRLRRAPTSIWPAASPGMTSTTMPRRARCRYVTNIEWYSVVEVRMTSPAASGTA